MRAILKLDKLNNIITFNCKGLNISFSVSPNIQCINALDEVDNGYMVIQTNIGEEYIDLLGMLEIENYDKSFIKNAETLLKDIRLEDITLEG